MDPNLITDGMHSHCDALKRATAQELKADCMKPVMTREEKMEKRKEVPGVGPGSSSQGYPWAIAQVIAGWEWILGG